MHSGGPRRIHEGEHPLDVHGAHDVSGVEECRQADAANGRSVSSEFGRWSALASRCRHRQAHRNRYRAT